MNYKSNLQAPDLRPYFKHIHERVEPNSQGHTVISDFADKADDDPVFGVHKRCWFWTLDEAAILYNCAKQRQGQWLDIGGHTGWTAMYLEAAGSEVTILDPMYRNDDFMWRALENTGRNKENPGGMWFQPLTSGEFFHSRKYGTFEGIVIDGSHDRPYPFLDAYDSMWITDLIIFHDYRGEPIKEAYRWLLDNGFQGRTYTTPNGVAVCWRGEFTPPEHVPDPKLEVCA